MISLNNAIPLISKTTIYLCKQLLPSSGYCFQYLRRLLRNGKLEGVMIGQTWLVKCEALDSYLKRTAKMAKHDWLINCSCLMRVIFL
jgi:hypothetical protein